jgi:uncharacterized membrane protein
VPLLAPSYKEVIMDLMTVFIAVVLVVGLWYVLNKRMDDIESDLETLSKATGKEDLLTKIHHRS